MNIYYFFKELFEIYNEFFEICHEFFEKLNPNLCDEYENVDVEILS